MNDLRKVDYSKNIFDVIRLVAALQVFFGHAVNHLELSNYRLITLLQVISNYFPGRGVIIFFFLSGFFSIQSVRKEVRILEYFKKKINRIYPELWMSVILGTIFILFSYTYSKKIIDWFIYFITQGSFFQFYTGDWLRDYGCGSPNGSLWTITVIIQFYFLIYFLNRMIKKDEMWILLYVISSFLSFTVSNVSYFQNNESLIIKIFAVSIIPYLHIFLLGVVAWSFKDYIIPLCRKYLLLFIVLYVLEQYIVSKYKIHLGFQYDVVSTLFHTMAILGIGFIGTKRFKVEFSYSVYLYHMLFINLFLQIAKIGNLDLRKYNLLFLFCSLVMTVFFSLGSSLLSKKIRILK